jgi:SAM-dependent methyltransferase
MTQQAFYSGLPWTIHRNSRGWPRWWQRWYEAWLVITGRYTFWHAFDQGKHCGSSNEFTRIIRNGGDLSPVMQAAVEVTYKHAMQSEIHPDVACHLRAAAWKLFKERSSVSRPHQPTPEK